MLAPFSDIDLLFITEDRPATTTLAAVEFMLYFLWDLGLKVGHATRSIDECIAEAERDLTIRTSLIDRRLLAGDPGLFEPFVKRFLQSCTDAGAGGFIAAKQAERDTRHHRYGETPFLVEPNIKEGRGGLRDLQTLYWMTRYVFGIQVMGELVGPDSPGGGVLTHQEAKHARRSWDFLWTVRFHLHYVAGRAEDRLTFDLQPVVGARMGYTRHGRQDGVERFMRHYFLTAREITRHDDGAGTRCRARGPWSAGAGGHVTDAALLEQGFVLAEGKLMSAPGSEFGHRPIAMLRILQVARDRSPGAASAGAARADPPRARRDPAARQSVSRGRLPRSACAGGMASIARRSGAKWLARC